MTTETPRPLVSVLVPIYNTEQYLKRCLDSITAQTYNNLHISLLDDGSTDSSSEICKEYAKRDHRIEFHSTQHSGIASARKQLAKLAKGTYTLFIDSDDWIETNTIQELVNTIETNRLDILTFKIAGDERNDSKSPCNDALILNKEQSIHAFLHHRSIMSSLCTKMVKTQLYHQIEFDPRITYGEDVMTTWNLLNQAQRVGITNNSYYHYNDTPGSITNRHFNHNTYSLHLVWDKIVKQCSIGHPKYLNAAYSQRAYCLIWLLYTALRSNKKRDSRIKHLQLKLKNSLSVALSDHHNTMKCKLFAISAAYLYTPTRLLLSPWRKHLSTLR
ncbi:MAG: glycosyltransferase family 2 protein [Paramuribaculum sp.]|nr:glycosyltransferase family 2 protein [Paramuribaculum sp.]